LSFKKKLPSYITEIMRKYPKVASGRKNHKLYHERLVKTLVLIKKYFKKN